MMMVNAHNAIGLMQSTLSITSVVSSYTQVECNNNDTHSMDDDDANEKSKRIKCPHTEIANGKKSQNAHIAAMTVCVYLLVILLSACNDIG